jgi:hypothetical protein
MNDMHRKLGWWTLVKLTVWTFAGTTGMAIIATRYA